MGIMGQRKNMDQRKTNSEADNSHISTEFFIQ